jgi:hypothetical protein
VGLMLTYQFAISLSSLFASSIDIISKTTQPMIVHPSSRFKIAMIHLFFLLHAQATNVGNRYIPTVIIPSICYYSPHLWIAILC